MRLPVRVVEVDLAAPLPDIRAAPNAGAPHYVGAQVLVRLHGEPLGLLQVNLDGGAISSAELRRRIAQEFGDSIAVEGAGDSMAEPAQHLRPEGTAPQIDGIAPPARSPLASVIVCTRERPDRLDACLRSLRRLRYPDFEVLVVDSAPTSSATYDVVTARSRDLPVAYLREERPGLARARNRGAAAAAGELLAFTDDDVVVDRDWLTGLARGFERADGVACTTGLSLPAELETASQVWFEEFGGFAKGFEPRVFDLDSHRQDPLYPYRLGAYGSGLNMAFNAAALSALGGFDELLGAGTKVAGGEDLDAFLRVILSERRLVYEPAAIVWHYHRRNVEELRRQLGGSGSALSAILTKLMLERETRRDLRGRLRFGLRYLLSPSSPKNQKKSTSFPASLTGAELLGVAQGPFLYLTSLWRARRESAAANTPGRAR